MYRSVYLIRKQCLAFYDTHRRLTFQTPVLLITNKSHGLFPYHTYLTSSNDDSKLLANYVKLTTHCTDGRKMSCNAKNEKSKFSILRNFLTHPIRKCASNRALKSANKEMEKINSISKDNCNIETSLHTLNSIYQNLRKERFENLKKTSCQLFVESIKRNNIVELYCSKCSLIMENMADNVFNNANEEKCFTLMFTLLISLSEDNLGIVDLIYQQTGFIETVTKGLKLWPYLPTSKLIPQLKLMACLMKIITQDDIEGNQKHELDLIRLLTLSTMDCIVDDSDKNDFTAKQLQPLLTAIKSSINTNEKETSDVFSLLDLLQLLLQIVGNMNTKRLLAVCEAFPLLVQISEFPDLKHRQYAVYVIRRLAVNDENRKDILEYKWGVRRALCKLSKSNDVDIKNISRDTLQTITDADSRPRILISCHLEQRDIGRDICDKLRKNKFNAFMDIEHMHFLTPESMKSSIATTDIFLMCFCQKYKDCHLCKSVATHAINKKSVILPINIANDYTPDGWLRSMLDKGLYYNYAETVLFNDALEVLVNAILKQLSIDKNRLGEKID